MPQVSPSPPEQSPYRPRSACENAVLARKLKFTRVRGWLALGLTLALGRLPLPVLHRVGAVIGFLFRRFPNRQRRNALINIGLCMPHLSASEQLELRDRALDELGRTAAEMPWIWLQPTPVVLSMVREYRGLEWLHQTNPGQGRIVLSPHIGSWELAGLYLAAQGPTTIFYKPQRYIDSLILASRSRSGATLAPTSVRGIRILVDALERGETVGLLPDQEPREDKGCVMAPFFGVPALTMLLVNRLVRRTGARVLFGFAERLEGTSGYRVHFLPAPPGIDSEDDDVAAAALNKGVEQCVLLRPDQFSWNYKRFRRRAGAVRNVYVGPTDDASVLRHVEALREQLDRSS